ncbi:MAG: hypothetical protein IPP48_06755 [Chitinophagaceae bacterium]|nr:hypothetical protein [Chitinophagaceae bacterium]
MVKLLFILFFTVSAICTQSQNVGIGTTNPNAYAALEISSSNKGLLIPRTSTSSRTAIAAPPKGLLVYDSSFSAFYYYDGGRWLPVSEKNYDSSTVDYSSSAIIGTNLPTSTGASISISSNDNSGFIYDNGGPSGNYLLNSNSSVTISQDDATLAIKITIEELNAETFYDSLFIIYGSSIFNGNTLDTVGISGTQLGSYTFNTNVKILFKSNAVNQLAGFKIRWSRIKMNTTATEPTPVYGWYFNTAKQAMLGGTSKNNNWQLDSIGINSFNYGIGAKAKGESAIAIGRFSSAINTNSISIGEISKAYGDGAISIGKFTEANSSYTTAIGYGNSANGYSATSIGHLANALGDLSVAIGSEYYIGTSYPTQAIADYATALGSAASARELLQLHLVIFLML